MFANECEKFHRPDYERSCCMKQLLLMSDHAENQMMNKTYANLLFNTLNRLYKNNNIGYNSMKLDLLKMLLEVITKFTAYFFLTSNLILTHR